jgi:biopolymer transport protein ExbD
MDCTLAMRCIRAVSVVLVILTAFPSAEAADCFRIVSLHNDGTIDFNGERFKNDAALVAKLRSFQKDQRCGLQIKTEPGMRFEVLGRLIMAMQKARIGRIGFVTEPQQTAPR